MTKTQFTLSLIDQNSNSSPLRKLEDILSQNFDFHSASNNFSSHNFHSFPAKFPPQIPRLFIDAFTKPGDLVLDPMQGSGTTVLEACLNRRYSIGIDIDPLALLITSVKTTPLEPFLVLKTCKQILTHARTSYFDRSENLLITLESKWDQETRNFIDYWFEKNSQLALMALLNEIEKIDDPGLFRFFKLVFSSIIVTKSGGVSLALDLAHTRPHRAKIIYSEKGEIIEGKEYLYAPSTNLKYATKNLRSPFIEFEKRVHNNVKGLLRTKENFPSAQVILGNAEATPLTDNSVDLIVTSPPYASNAIDYMRAHKFSLVWFGFSIQDLSELRGNYIGGESLNEFLFEPLPESTSEIINELSNFDKKKSQVLHRYYSEMTRILREIYRILKPGKVAIVVVGSSKIRGRDTQTQQCLAEIGLSLGFKVPKIGIRNLDRDRRMLPAGINVDLDSKIQQRMHQEFLIGFYKPD